MDRLGGERDWSEADMEGAAGLPAHTVLDYERDPEKLTREVAERVIYITHPSQIVEAHLQRARGKDPSGEPKWLLNQMEAQMLVFEAALCGDARRHHLPRYVSTARAHRGSATTI